jgi:ribosome-binding factor A
MVVRRAERVGGLIQKELSDLLVTKIKDPRLVLVTITEVKVTDDLRSAQVYFSIVEGPERRQDAAEGFESAAGYLKRQLSHRLALRRIPELTFVYDKSFDQAAAVERIFKTIHHETQSTVGKSSRI